MAAAGLLMDEKGGAKEFAILKWLRKTIEDKWKRKKQQREEKKHKMAIREDKQQQNNRKNSANKNQSKCHARRGKASPEDDLEGGQAGANHRLGNDEPTPKVIKKITALKSQHQLRHLPLNNANKKETASVVPIIVYDEGDNDTEQHMRQQQKKTMSQMTPMAVDRREAARIACWASPELSCEGLSLRVNKTQRTPRGTTDTEETDTNGNSRRIDCDERKCKFETVPAEQTDCCFWSSSPTSSTLSSSAGLVVSDRPPPPFSLAPTPCQEMVPPAFPSLFGHPEKPFLRRASALASLLDPINIGSGDRTKSQQQINKDNLRGEDGATTAATTTTKKRQQPSMSTQGKWRHAVRKLQMNKREAGRIQAKKIDAWSRWAFPLTYLSFHGAYWYYYLRIAA